MDFVWKNRLQLQIIDNEIRNLNMMQWLKLLMYRWNPCSIFNKIIIQKKSKILIKFTDIFEFCKVCNHVNNDSTLTLKTSDLIQTYPASIFLAQRSSKTKKFYNRCTINAYVLQYGNDRFVTFKLEHPGYDGLLQTFVVPLQCKKNGAIIDQTNASITIDNSEENVSALHIELRHALDVFVNDIDKDLSTFTWRCKQCKTRNHKISMQCYNCPSIVSEESNFKQSEDKNYFKGQTQQISVYKETKYECIDEQTTKWYGDVNIYHSRYEHASYFYYDFIDNIKNFGAEIALPFWHHNKFDHCYCSELYWLGLCNHIFIKMDKDLNKEETITETLSIFDTDHYSNQAKMKQIVDAFNFVDDDGNKTTQIFFAILSKLTNYKGWVVEDIADSFVADIRDLMDEEFVTSQQIVHTILNMNGYKDMNECVDLDQIDDFVGIDDTFFAMNITPLRHIVYTSKSGRHSKYLMSETFKKVKDVQKYNSRLGGTIMYRFCHENLRKKFKFDSNHRQMLQKMNFFTDYPVYIGGIEHSFVTPLNSNSKQVVNVNDSADMNELNDMMNTLTLSIKTSPKLLNKSGYSWSVLESSFGPNPFDAFKKRKKAWVDYRLHQQQEQHRKAKKNAILQPVKKRKLENQKTEKIIAIDEKDEMDIDFDDIDELDVINFSALSIFADEKNDNEHKDVCVISSDESDDEFGAFMKDKREKEYAQIKDEEELIKIKDEKTKDADYVYYDEEEVKDEWKSEDELDGDEYDSDDTDLEWINPSEAKKWYQPVLKVVNDSEKVIDIKIYNKSLYYLSDVDTESPKFEKEFEEMKSKFLDNQNRIVEHSHLRSGRTTSEIHIGGAEPVYWKYPNLRKKIDKLMAVYTPLEHTRSNGENIDWTKYNSVKKGIIICCKMIEHYHIDVVNNAIEPWIFDEDIYKKDRLLEDNNESDDDDVDL